MENPGPYSAQQPPFSQQVSLPNATAVLVLGIVSIVTCLCYGIVGLICSIISLVLYGKDKKLYLANPAAYTAGSYSNLKSGRVCAIIGLILSSIYLLFVIIFLIVFGSAALSNPDEILRHFGR